MKKLLSLVLAFTLCLSLVPASFASEPQVNQPPTEMVWDGPSLDPGIAPYSTSAVYWYQANTINNGMATNFFHYRLDEDFQYAKIWIQNDSGASIHVWSSYNGKDFGESHLVKDGRTTTIYVSGNGNTGDFYFNARTDNGVALDGLITILTGTKLGVNYPW